MLHDLSLLDQAIVAAELGDVDFMRQYLATDPPLKEYADWPLKYAAGFAKWDIVEMIVKKGGKECLDRNPQIIKFSYAVNDWRMAAYLLTQGAEGCFIEGIVSYGVLAQAPLELIQALAACATEDEATKSMVQKTPLLAMNVIDAVEKYRLSREDVLDWILSSMPPPDEAARDIFDAALDKAPAFLPLLKRHGVFFENDPDHESPLIRAIRADNLAGVKALLALGANPNRAQTISPFSSALAHYNEEIVKALIDAGTDVYAYKGLPVVLGQPPVEPGLAWKVGKALAYQAAKLKAALDEAAKPPETYEDFLLAAKAGVLPDVFKEFTGQGKKISALDIGKAATGTMTHVLSVLGVRGEIGCLLDHRLWSDPERDFALLGNCIAAGESFAQDAADELARMRVGQRLGKLQQIKKNAGRFKL